jgi:serine/threonine protein kinase
MLNENEVIAGKYRIVRHLNRGMMANAYEARLVADGRRVFFKEYISPRPSKSWYASFVRHQLDLTNTLQRSSAAQFCLLAEETFEADKRVTASGETRKTPATLYQSFEFIDGGLDLEKRLAKDMTWEDRRMFSSVFVFGLREVHAAGVIHTDLKPANLQIIEKPGPGGRIIRTPRLIDMDFSILADQRPPWHGHSGYVGTAGYMSPEHLGGPDSVPVAASDVFTAGLILHELLGTTNPLAGLADDDYIDRVKAGKVSPLKLAGTFGSPEHDARVVDLVSRCLSFDHRRRPAAAELHQAIIGTKPTSSAPARGPEPVAAGDLSMTPPVRGGGLRLIGSGGHLDLRVSTTVGRNLLARFGDDSKFAASEQYRLTRDGDEWFLEHLAKTGNQTIVNGRAVDGRVRIGAGDRVAIGNASKGIEKVAVHVEHIE